jgi:small-conductance mechanosensitive channel
VVKSELGVAVYAALGEAGLSIPFPQHEIRIHPTAPAESGEHQKLPPGVF